MAVPDVVQSKVNTGLPFSAPKRQNFLVLKENGGRCAIGLHMETVQGRLTVVPQNKRKSSKVTQGESSSGNRVRPEPADAAVETKVPVQHFVNLFVDVLGHILLVGQLIFHVSFDVHGLKRSSVCPKYL